MKNLKPPINLGQPRNIGYEGESFVAYSLPGAIHINAVQEARQHWDVEWNGLLLDIKTTKAKRTTPRFSGIVQDKRVIFVYVDMSYMDELHFWVRHATQGFKNMQSLTNSIRIEALPQAILDCHKEYSQIYKKTVDNQLPLLYT